MQCTDFLTLETTITYHLEFGIEVIDNIETEVISSYRMCETTLGGGGTTTIVDLECGCELCLECGLCTEESLPLKSLPLPDDGENGTNTEEFDCPVCSCDCDFAANLGLDCEELLSFENDYRNLMSEAEKLIFDNRTRIQQLSYLANAQIATWESESRYPNSLYNGIGDAFRHAFWNACNVIDLGMELARDLATAHEDKPSSYPYNYKENEMDLFNNNIGRNLSDFPSHGCSSLIDCIENAINNGSLRYLGNLDSSGSATSNSQLKPTNQ